MIISIIMITISIIAGIALVVKGIILRKEECGKMAIFFGVCFILLYFFLFCEVRHYYCERTEKIIDKGTVKTEISTLYNKEDDNNKVDTTYFLVTETGQRIVVDESTWETVVDEYVYIPVEIETMED